MNTQLSIAAEQVQNFINTLPVNFLHVDFETGSNFVVAFGENALVSVSYRSGRYVVVNHNPAYRGRRVNQVVTKNEVVEAVEKIISSK